MINHDLIFESIDSPNIYVVDVLGCVWVGITEFIIYIRVNIHLWQVRGGEGETNF